MTIELAHTIRPECKIDFNHQHEIRASDISAILDYYADKIKVLSLDCFDTLIWRNVAAPKDIFYIMQQRSLAQSLGVTAHQRIQAADRAYRLNFINKGANETTLREIYSQFISLKKADQLLLAEEELNIEVEMSYAFFPFVELIREARNRGIKIIIVSNTYLKENELRLLLKKNLPNDVMDAIDYVFCSTEFGKSKNDGLFNTVLEKLSLSANDILHIGDHKSADYSAPRQLGMHALHFVQFDKETEDFLNMQHTAGSLISLTKPSPNQLQQPRYNPYRGLLAMHNLSSISHETKIGYLSFGPILYAFARFICDEIEAMRQAGKRPKVFFLLRDAHLLALACEAYAGKPIGKEIHLRKFGTVAASFRTRADVDHYLASLAPQYYDFWVICAQLLLPNDAAVQIINQAYQSSNPEKTFNEIIHQEQILQFVYQQSAAYRDRLKRYMIREMELTAGDTVVLVDTGYMGVTQDFLTRSLQEELQVEIIGRYLIATHDPHRPSCHALITSADCDHGLFEQSCTFKEGSVLDYDMNGYPIFDNLRLSEDQYNKVQAIQSECIRFIHDANYFFNHSNISLPFSILQNTAVAALKRHVYLPIEAEIQYFKNFQHDKDMGPKSDKTIFNLNNGLATLQHGGHLSQIHPYEARAENIQFALSAMVQKAFDVDLKFSSEDICFRHETIKIINRNGNSVSEITVKAVHSHDGYYTLYAPVVNGAHLIILFGQHYQWLQINSINLITPTAVPVNDLNQNITLDGIINKKNSLFECQSKTSSLTILPIIGNHIYHIVFRPIEKWTN